MRKILWALAALALVACGSNNTDNDEMETNETYNQVDGRKNFGTKQALMTTPQPCVMIATWDKDKNPDVMMAAWAGQYDTKQIVVSMSKHKTTENLLVSGIDCRTLPVGTLLRTPAVTLRVTQIGKECHSHCAIYHRVGTCIMPREGVFAEVLAGGTVTPGDVMTVELPQEENG